MPRYLDKSQYQPQTIDGIKYCRYCKNQITEKRRKTFCSAVCVHEYLIRTNGTYLRKSVYQRDKGICKVCGIDTKIIAKKILAFGAESPERIELLKQYDIPPSRVIRKRKFGGSLWDADHIMEVKNDGGCCDMDNLQTLCIKCHKDKSYGRIPDKKMCDFGSAVPKLPPIQ